MITIANVNIGESFEIKEINLDEESKKYLNTVGIVEGSIVTIVGTVLEKNMVVGCGNYYVVINHSHIKGIFGEVVKGKRLVK